MRKRLYILLVGLSLASVLMAQPRLSQPEIFLGVHSGVKASTMVFDPSVKPLNILQSPLSGNGGLVFRYAEHKVCALQIECNYVQKGWAEVYQLANQEQGLYQRHLHYIEIPMLMHLGFGKRNFKFFFNLGPQIGYCVADESVWTGNGVVSLNEVQHQPIDNPFDWGAAAGLGCYYKSKKAGLFHLEARFDYSLGSLFDVGPLEYFKMANPMGLSVNIAYMWQFKKR